jgi:hypothetical protein
MKLRHVLFKIDPPKFKKNANYKEDESDIDDDWIIEHKQNLQKKIEKAGKKFVKENEKLQEDGQNGTHFNARTYVRIYNLNKSTNPCLLSCVSI